MTERFARLSTLYHEALARDPASRDAFLRDACGGDDELRDEVTALLAQPASAAAFFSSPDLALAATAGTVALTGHRFGAYVLGPLLGAGGMGDVYRARDTQLDRDVAVKVLPPALAMDRARLARFEREARTLASIRHPHIGAIFGVVASEGLHGLVLELVDGPTLAERLTRGRLPEREAFDIARQLADALESTHEQGIIHRDLKPANVKITPDGTVKLLDFGLAKVLDAAAVGGSGAVGTTMPGTVMGTATYMSPEQARGEDVDRRADVWAFGCVLYEMLTGRTAFPGDTVAETFAAVLERQPDWSALPPATSVDIRRLLVRCLEKNPRRRLRDIGDARVALEDALAGERVLSPVPRADSWMSGRMLAVGSALVLLAVAATAWAFREGSALPPLQPLVQLDVDLGSGVTLGTSIGSDVILSPDGRRLAFVSGTRLFARRLDQSRAVELSGTDGAFSPFFSPDGEWIAFFADRKLKKVPFTGGEVSVLCDAPAGRGGTWSPDNTIIVALGALQALARVPAGGGPPVPLTTRAPGEMTHRWPQILPGGRAVLFTSHSAPNDFDQASIEVATIPDARRTTLIREATHARYVAAPGGRGFLAYANRGTLFAVEFDPEALTIHGTPFPVLEGAEYSNLLGFVRMDVSASGTLVYRRMLQSSLQWLDADGAARPLLAAPGRYESPTLSPDGAHLAVRSGSDVLMYDSVRDRSVRLAEQAFVPVWAPDGRHVVVAQRGGMAWVRADASSPPSALTRSADTQIPSSFTPDGRWLAYQELVAGRPELWDLFLLPIRTEGGRMTAGTPVPLLQTAADERNPTFSPDGRWFAYASADSGRFEIYVRAFPDDGRRRQVSFEGGVDPNWTKDGRQLLFTNTGDHLMVADVTLRAADIFFGTPRLWSARTLASAVQNYTIAPGRANRVAALLPATGDEFDRVSNHVVLMFNVADEMRRRSSGR